MKFSNKLIGMTLTAIAAGALIGCTNELNGPNAGNGNGQLKLVRTPDVIAWSGKQYLENTRSGADISSIAPALAQNMVPVASASTRTENISWIPVTTENLVPEEEFVIIENKLKEGEAQFSGLISDFLFFAKEQTELEFYPVYGQSGTAHDIGIFYYDERGEYHECEVIWHDYNIKSSYYPSEWEPDKKVEYSKDSGCESPLDENGHLMGYKIIVPQGYKFGFYFTLAGFSYEYIPEEPDQWGNRFPQYEDIKKGFTSSSLNKSPKEGDIYSKPNDPKWNSTIRAAVFYEDGKTYLGFEDWQDYDYQDIVFTSPIIIETVTQDNILPGVTQEEFENGEGPNETVCDHCGHKGHPSQTNDCQECKDKGHAEGAEGSCWEDPKICDKSEECHDAGHAPHEDGNCPSCGPNEGCNHKDPEVCDKSEECHDAGHAPHEDGNCPSCGPNEGCNHKDPEVCDKSDECHDAGHAPHEDGNCPSCGPNEGCNATQSGNDNPGTTTPSNPGDQYKHKNEVEVNFELVDSHDNLGEGVKDLASKLSIHVRHATDVEILIPVPGRYTVASDDLYIFHEHYGAGEGYHGTYGGSLGENGYKTLEYNVGGTTVYLNVEIVIDSDLNYPFDQGYIKVWTEGIDQNVIEYCMEHNGDGINFEVWTYFGLEDENNTRTDLLGYLNKSIIKFLDSNPDYYINAFGYDYEDGTWGQQHLDEINPDDCHVKPVDKENYPNYKTGTHLNGTPYNDIYTRNGVTADHAHSNTKEPAKPNDSIGDGSESGSNE